MGRLIDADALKERIRSFLGIKSLDDLLPEEKAIVQHIDRMPTVDAVPVRKGQWRHYEGVLTCSECGTEYYDDIIEWCDDHVPKFCPDCGADMRKDGDRHD